jgi:hypothetical protein
MGDEHFCVRIGIGLSWNKGGCPEGDTSLCEEGGGVGEVTAAVREQGGGEAAGTWRGSCHLQLLLEGVARR